MCIEGKTKSVRSFFTREESDELTSKIQNRGGEIIKKQNLSSGLSAAGAIARHLSDLFVVPLSVQSDSVRAVEGKSDSENDSKIKSGREEGSGSGSVSGSGSERETSLSLPYEAFSCGTLSDENPYGVPKGIVFSFPCYLKDGVIKIIPNLPMDGSTIRMMNTSVEELMAEKLDAETFLMNLPTPKL